MTAIRRNPRRKLFRTRGTLVAFFLPLALLGFRRRPRDVGPQRDDQVVDRVPTIIVRISVDRVHPIIPRQTPARRGLPPGQHHARFGSTSRATIRGYAPSLDRARP